MTFFKVESEGHVQTWTMSNPPMNYMTAAMSQELTELIGRAEADENLRAIILTGGIEGKFITHYSVDELARAPLTPRSARAPFLRWKRDFIACSIASC
jgi:enoyl-CoA hydratase